MIKTHSISTSTRKYLIFGMQCVISLVALAYALYGVEFTILLGAVQGYSYGAIIVVLIFIGLDYSAMGVRLSWLLPKNIPYSINLQAVLVCVGYNNLLPAKAGDGIKILFLKESTGLSLLCVGSAILWERVFDVFMLLGFAFLAYLLVDLPYASTLPIVALIIGILTLYALRRYSLFFKELYAKISHKGIARVMHILHTEIIDKVTYRWAVYGLFISICIWSLYFLSFAVALLYVAGFSLNIAQLLTIFVVVCVGMSIPSTPGGLGVFEAAMVLSLSWFNIGRDEALGIALVLHALYFIPATLAALYIMLLKKRNNEAYETFSK